MKTEQEVVAKIQTLEAENDILNLSNKAIEEQPEIDQVAMGILLENQKKIKSNRQVIEVLNWMIK
ncbi:MAG: hypothetical protein M3Q05_06210 [Bacteroidota bacterium]|nr:hypothetical protein [Bacteroidota bacterium]